MEISAISPPAIPVAEYVRMSTEHQQYSTENQSEIIRRYAQTRGMNIVRTYADHGKSGLNLSGRLGLGGLLRDVQSGASDFVAVLVYDVSRWGRFQDADESAYYEYVLKQAGIRVHYCAEPFENDDSLPSALIKTLKRTMAGEYSRELSVKVFAGQCRLVELGFRQGGAPGYGLRRHLIDEHGVFKQVLDSGERKSLQTDRVILVPGPPQEVEIVRRIFSDFTESEKSEQQIANGLNDAGIVHSARRPWTRATVCAVLRNPKYMGSNVYNRRSFKLRRKRVRNPPEMWIARADAFESVVSKNVFERAQFLIAERSRRYSDDELLAFLRMLLRQRGILSGFIIDEAEDIPGSEIYRSRFGSLPRAYSLIGWTPSRDYEYLEINRRLRGRYREVVESILQDLRSKSAHVSKDDKTDLITINREYTASLILARCHTTSAGSHRWIVRFDGALEPDITIAARFDSANASIMDYYLLPRLADLGRSLRLRFHNPLFLEVFRFNDLHFFSELARRASSEYAA
jgi:DNA invertase Pin-like site-specific DNA recombinase